VCVSPLKGAVRNTNYSSATKPSLMVLYPSTLIILSARVSKFAYRMIDADTSSHISSEIRIMVNVHVVPDSEDLSTSGFALTALHCVHILVLLPTMLKHAMFQLAAMSRNAIAMTAD
jgi:hypothetical protein